MRPRPSAPSSLASGLVAALVTVLVGACAATPEATVPAGAEVDADELLIVDCLLPGQVRRLGTRLTYLSPRRPVKTSASICELRGGEYVAFDRANFSTALKIWLPQAEEGDAEAQTYVGEIYEKGLGTEADYELAALWYRRAAEQGYSRASINLGYLHEAGLGVEQDLTEAMNLYRRASGLLDGDLEYVSSVEYANRAAASARTAFLEEEVVSLQRRLEEAEARYAERRASVERAEAELVDLREAVEAERRRVLALADDEAGVRAASEADAAVASEQVARADAEAAAAAESLALAAAENERLREALARASAATDEREAEFERLRDELARTAAVAAGREAELERLQASLASSSATTSERQAEFDRLRAELELSAAERASRELALERLEAELARSSDTTAEREAELERLRAELERTAATTAEREAELDRLAAELARSAAVTADREAELDVLRAELAATSAEATAADAEARARRAALEARLVSVGGELEQARAEQTRLGGRLRDAELDAARQERGDAMIIAGLDLALADRERELERERSRVGALEVALARTESELVAAPDRAERERLQREIATQNEALRSARAEQVRLTDRLRDEQLEARRRQRESDTRLAALERQLAEREAALATQREQLLALESEVADGRVRLTSRDSEAVAAVVRVGPSIDIIDPPVLVTRGKPTLGAADRRSIELIGKVDPVDSVLTFKINGTAQPLSTAGVFRYFVESDARELELLAVDEAGDATRLELDLGRGTALASTPSARDEAEAAADTLAEAAIEAAGTGSSPELTDAVLDGVDFGNYHALVIGNDDYASLSDLNTAVEDARTVERLLRERYGFETELLLNATRRDMLLALARLREKLTPEDNLVVYYAGHGELDDVSRRGYWLPVDAELDDTRNWISNAAITDQIDAMPAKHVMIVADSCYSGTLTRSSVARQPPDMAPELRARWYAAMAGSKVRTVLSSGGVRPVIDGAPGAKHSIFAQAFIDELEENAGVLEAYSLFIDVQLRVAESARALNVEQSPEYSPIRHSGHEAGEFIFVARPDTA